MPGTDPGNTGLTRTGSVECDKCCSKAKTKNSNDFHFSPVPLWNAVFLDVLIETTRTQLNRSSIHFSVFVDPTQTTRVARSIMSKFMNQRLSILKWYYFGSISGTITVSAPKENGTPALSLS